MAQQLDLAKIQPVLVSNDLGEILGEAFPERGVMLAFEPGPEPGKPSLKVTHIMLEAISAEPFVLRAETNLDTRPDFSLRDLDQALKLQRTNARRIGCGAACWPPAANMTRRWTPAPRRSAWIRTASITG